ncbi:MAG TPA: penicillin-binding protein [Spirochaetota bacterium]|nr:penicillin-binding protein [Spirochaetota bacterium]
MANLRSIFRLRIALFFIVAVSILIIIRVLYLSSINPDSYQSLDKGEYTLERGNIYDSTGILLAASDILKSVYSNPKEVQNKEETALSLSKILGLTKTELYDKLQSKKSFIWLKRHVSPEQESQIKELNLKGIYLKEEYKRFYPNKNLASHILGFCNIDSGVEGIEKSMDSYLLTEISGAEDASKKKYFNVNLTIDANIQAFTEYVLKNGALRENSDIATLIFLDGKSGDIISMANYPDFDPNFFTRYNQETFRNASIFYQYEPGSVFKIFSLSPCLDSGLITENTYFFCDGLFDNVSGVKIRCSGIHGSVNLSGIMKYSCNEGTLQAIELISSESLYLNLKKFGFGESSSILLPGEQPGSLKKLKNWSINSKYTIPIGQEVGVNALQMVRAATVFVNDGTMVETNIVKSITDRDNKIIKEFGRKEIRDILKKGISRRILDTLIEATMTGGTARRLNIEGIQFAAKSGTAQIFDKELGRYSDDEVTSSLLVFFPFENPRYIIYMVYHKPKGRIRWGGNICSVLLNEFISGIIGYYRIGSEEEYSLSEKDVVIDKRYKLIEKTPFIMPDLSGIPAGDALDILSKVNVKVKVAGMGIVYAHDPQKGATIKTGDEIILYLK